MSENHEKPMWRCRKCGHIFTPLDKDFSCPNCSSNATAPDIDFESLKELREPRVLQKYYCTECGELMVYGFIIERESPFQLATFGQGIYWTPDEWGNILSSISLKAYACPNCGKIDLRIGNLSGHQQKMEKIREKQYEDKE